MAKSGRAKETPICTAQRFFEAALRKTRAAWGFDCNMDHSATSRAAPSPVRRLQAFRRGTVSSQPFVNQYGSMGEETDALIDALQSTLGSGSVSTCFPSWPS